MGKPSEYASQADRLVLSGLRSKGEAWIVGGWVRESASGEPSTDMDIATNLLPEEVKNLFPLSLMYGAEYGTVVVRLEDHEKSWEVTTLRSEGGYGDGRRPDNVEFGVDINGDLSRRDFTINAMAYDSEWNLIDPFGGSSDMENGILKSVGNATERLSEDGLRVMRAYRFLASEKVVSMDAELSLAVRDNVGMLEQVSKERIGDEMMQTLASPNASAALSMMQDDGVIHEILPGLSASTYPVLCGDSLVNLALVCSGDERSGAELIALLRDSLKMSTDDLREIAFLHNARNAPIPSEISEMRVFRAALPVLRQTRFIRYCEGLGRDIGGFDSSLSELAPLRAGNSPIVDGNVLSEATGLEPGPKMGRLKGMLHRIQVERDLNDSGEVLALLEELDWMESEHENWPVLGWP
ncbi:MAG TPA: hypothetical protein D7H75_00460 [Candidatus Poseidoniales archaeon]|nr:MAG TPA: hypothetical protein D7H75_00460 [Candidatus Poseidoniales archaeon]HIH55712.1 hypothetical protein [Candidatus Thalassarchaeum sp.]|tara:strand:+ start:1532 stop:2761 length:1230 start_codon:yes stop_codon:yes gene_type:complete